MSAYMFKLLKKAHDNAEELKGRRLYLFLTATFVIFLAAGLSLGYFVNVILNKYEINPAKAKDQEISIKSPYEGKVMFVDPKLYPDDQINYVLVDDNGKEIILLKSKDQKLTIAEGHHVLLEGALEKLRNGESSYLLVEKVILKNGSN